jgi:predicted naringenin-chalcone synthase
VIDSLGLSPGVQRYQLGFMGCYAAIPALRMADQFCRADPSAVVLVVCIELCTIHMQNREYLDSVVANSVFADGLAAVLVSGRPPVTGDRGFEMSHFASGIAREGAGDMAWDIGDHGFNIVLSKYVAKIIGAGIREIIDDAFIDSGRSPADIRTWAVHPGGRAILDKVESSLGLQAKQIEASRATFSRFGNMSSATILFVLAEILRNPDFRDGDSICAMAFGPGLTIETSILDALVS